MSALTVKFSNNSGYPDSDVSIGFFQGQPAVGQPAPLFNITNLSAGGPAILALNGGSTFPTAGNWYTLTQLESGVSVTNFSGRIYVCYGQPWVLQGPGSEPGQAVTDPAFFMRYDKMEMTFNGSQYDVADLTSIDYWSIPMKLQTSLSGVVVQTVYGLLPGVITPQVFNELNALTTPPVSGLPSVGGVDGNVMPALVPGEFQEYPGGVNPNPIFARIIGPSSYPPVGGRPVTPYDLMTGYLNYLNTNFGPGTISGVTIPGMGAGVIANIAGNFAGVGPDVPATGPQSQQTYSLQATIDADLNITLTGTVSGVSGTTTMVYANADLLNPTGIYGGNAPFTLNGAATTPANDVYGWVAGDLFAGINVGALGSTVEVSDVMIGAMNSQEWFTLSSNYYFSGMQSISTYYNQWASTVVGLSNAYEFAYSERFAHVLASLNPATVDTMQIVLEPGLLVQSNKAWQDTGVAVQSDVTVTTVTYTCGTWTANPNVNGGQMYDAAGNPNIQATQTGYPLLGANEGALIGRVGDSGTPFLIGNGPTVVPEGSSGKLLLCINDDLPGLHGAGLTDNKGSICVSIQVG